MAVGTTTSGVRWERRNETEFTNSNVQGSYDPLALAGAGLALGLCAAVAGFIPARRAASIEPMRALRIE